MRYLIALDRERGEGVLSTETGIVLRFIKDEGGDILSLLQRLTDKIPFSKKQAAIHISYGDGADGERLDRLEEEIKPFAGDKTAVLCEDRMVHRIYSAFEKDEDGIIIYVSPDAGAGRIWRGGVSTVGGVGAPVYSEGSMFALAVKTIRAGLSAAENTAPPTLLTGFLEEATGLPAKNIKNALSGIAPHSLSEYARLSAKGKQFGDKVSAFLWNETVSALTRYILTLSGGDAHLAVKLSETPKTLTPFLLQDLSASLGDRFSVSASNVPVLVGGIKRGAEMLGISADDVFCRTLMDTYKNFSI